MNVDEAETLFAVPGLNLVTEKKPEAFEAAIKEAAAKGKFCCV